MRVNVGGKSLQVDKGEKVKKVVNESLGNVRMKNQSPNTFGDDFKEGLKGSAYAALVGVPVGVAMGFFKSSGLPVKLVMTSPKVLLPYVGALGISYISYKAITRMSVPESVKGAVGAPFRLLSSVKR